MPRKLQIELEDEVFQQLKELCKGNESIMKDYIVRNLKEKFSSGEKDDLEGNLKKGQSGSRNYGVKGQGW